MTDKKNKTSTLQDYPALKMLAESLWQKDSNYHGAAVMVGAGFSRCSSKCGDETIKLPLWGDLSRLLSEALDTHKNSDPLRLAEEYCSYFGKQNLYDLLRQEINDQQWSPGDLHNPLLELPWSEVLTTNWDTLLERASFEVHQRSYNLVTKVEDLSSVRAPRIVKLHGTINQTKDLIFTQEDYRCYPQKHAAFVNFTRQVFIENELCLLGFSGDDPNFLQWSGWVRDNLDTHARRIYLVGALHLTSAKRKYLESINISPIDLYELVEDLDPDQQHYEATKEFINALIELKPRSELDWIPTYLIRSNLTSQDLDKIHKDHEHSALLLKQQIPILQSDRKEYPNWLVCPNDLLGRVRGQVCDPYPSIKNLAALDLSDRAKLIYELAWRMEISFERVDKWLAKEFLDVCNPEVSNGLSKKQQLQIAVFALKNLSRYNIDDETWALRIQFREILDRNLKYWPECANELIYLDAILARDNFDYPLLELLVEKLQCFDAVWRLRKASLCAELGWFDEGEELVSEAYKDLSQQYKRNRNSVFVISRLAWCHWLKRGVEVSKTYTYSGDKFPSIYQEFKSNPWDSIQDIQSAISKDLDEQRKSYSIEPLFEAGSYRNRSQPLTPIDDLPSFNYFDRLTNDVGLPIRWENMSFMVSQASILTDLDSLHSIHKFSLAIRSANNDKAEVLNKVFSRTLVANYSKDEVELLVQKLLSAVQYWIDRIKNAKTGQHYFAVSRLAVFSEVLARLSLRLSGIQAKKIFKLGVDLTKRTDIFHQDLFAPLSHLIAYSKSSIPESEQGELLLECLSIPLTTELKINDNRGEWPNPVIEHCCARESNPEVTNRVSSLIDSVSASEDKNINALMRLIPLFKNGFLEDKEIKRLTKAIWGDPPNLSKLPIVTGLFKFAFLELPNPDTAVTVKLIKEYLFNFQGKDLFDNSYLLDIESAACYKANPLLPTESEARNLFEGLTTWQPMENDPLGLNQNVNIRTVALIGRVLSNAVIPALTIEELNKDNFEKLLSFFSDYNVPELLVGLSIFAASNKSLTPIVEKILRKEIISPVNKNASYAAFGLLRWRKLNDCQEVNKLIGNLIFLIGTKYRPSSLWAVGELLKESYLSESDVDLLTETLPIIFDNSAYLNHSLISEDVVNLSLVRAECIKLAKAIQKNKKTGVDELNRIILEASTDPLPEVRFA